MQTQWKRVVALLQRIVLTLSCVIILGLMAPETEARAATEYLLRINVHTNVVTAYQNGVPVHAMTCTTGYNTPSSGRFRLGEQYRWHQLFGGLSGQYCSRITDHILFHSVPYTRLGDPSSLKPGNYDRLGTTASDGCVRLCVRDAKWIYEHCHSSNTYVETFWGNASDDPLGKPGTIKVAGLPSEFYGWDPTDENPASPFNKVGNYFGVAFDATYYANHNPDLLALYGYDEPALKVHWLRSGIKECRKASPWLDINVYKENYSDLKQIFGDDPYAYVKHFLQNGKAEGRQGALRFGKDINLDGSLITYGDYALYRLCNTYSGEHFYTGNLAEVESLIQSGWDYEGFFFTMAIPEEGGIPVYRLYQSSTGDHHYTLDENEKSVLLSSGWTDEGIAWYADPDQTTPIYRLCNPNKEGAGVHFFTPNTAEKDALVAVGWRYEGIGFYEK